MYSVKMVKAARKKKLIKKILETSNEVGGHRIQGITVEKNGLSLGRNNIAYIAYSTNDVVNKEIKEGALRHKRYRSFFARRIHKKSMKFINTLDSDKFVTYIFRNEPTNIIMSKMTEIFYIE